MSRQKVIEILFVEMVILERLWTLKKGGAREEENQREKEKKCLESSNPDEEAAFYGAQSTL